MAARNSRLLLAFALLALVAVSGARPDNGKGKGPKPKNTCGAVGAGGAPGTCAACAGSSKKCKLCNQEPGGRGFYPSPKAGCIGCKDVNCANCGNGGSCKTCVTGLALQGNKCMDCTQPNMVLKKGRCYCAAGYVWNAGRIKTECVLKTTA